MKPIARARLPISATAALLLTIGCSGAPIEGLVSRAQFDLNCPERDIRVQMLDDKTRGVTGCGKRATYLEVCDTTGWGNMNCRWVLNSPVPIATTADAQSAPPAATAPPPAH